MAGWIGFAGIVMLVLGGIDLFQGLIAVVKDDYYSSDSWETAEYPLWALTALTLNVIVLYALTARWSESKEVLELSR